MLVFLKSLGYKSLNFEGHFYKTLYEYEKRTELRVLLKKNPLTYCLHLPTIFCKTIFVCKKWLSLEL